MSFLGVATSFNEAANMILQVQFLGFKYNDTCINMVVSIHRL